MNFSEIFKICQQLNEAGKDPSVALIKARLSRPVPLPQVIAGLKQWRNNTDKKMDNKVEESDTVTPLNLEPRVEALESTVERLMKELERLKLNEK